MGGFLCQPVFLSNISVCYFSFVLDICRRKLWQHQEEKPTWWPERIPYRSPNTTPKLSVLQLDDLLACLSEFLHGSEEQEGEGERELSAGDEWERQGGQKE